MTYLSPAPLYHAAPHYAVGLTIRMGGTAVIMEHFEPEEYLKLVEKYRPSHTQLVPTMFWRMLKLPERCASNTTSRHWSVPFTPPPHAQSRSRSR